MIRFKGKSSLKQYMPSEPIVVAALGHRGTTHGTNQGEELGEEEEAEGLLGAGMEVQKADKTRSHSLPDRTPISVEML
jgi:hypothetical protein